MANRIGDENFVDLEIRIFPSDERSAGYPVEITLGGQQEFQGHLSADFLPWTSSGDLVADGQRLVERRLRHLGQGVGLELDADAGEQLEHVDAHLRVMWPPPAARRCNTWLRARRECDLGAGPPTPRSLPVTGLSHGLPACARPDILGSGPQRRRRRPWAGSCGDEGAVSRWWS